MTVRPTPQFRTFASYFPIPLALQDVDYASITLEVHVVLLASCGLNPDIS